jgi:hypothetical protein
MSCMILLWGIFLWASLGSLVKFIIVLFIFHYILY